MGPGASDSGSDMSDTSSNPGMDPRPCIEWYMCRPDVSDIVELAGIYDDTPMVRYSTTGWVSRRISNGPIKGCIQAPPFHLESLGLGRGGPADGFGLFYFYWPDVSDPKWIVELAGFHNDTPMHNGTVEACDRLHASVLCVYDSVLNLSPYLAPLGRQIHTINLIDLFVVLQILKQ